MSNEPPTHFTAMGKYMDRGQFLVLSIWDDYAVDMLWLDSTSPTNNTEPGSFRGSCPITSGVPSEVEADYPNSSVTFSNIKIGPIGSTFNGGSTGTGRSGSSTSSSAAGSKTSTSSMNAATTSSVMALSSAASGAGLAKHWGQCGGIGWTRPTQCVSPYTCQIGNSWHSQCL